MMNEKMDWKLWKMLQLLGMPPHMKGTEYLYHAVLLWEPGKYLTKEIYPEVAKKCGTNWIAVERAARYAIEYAWDHRRGNTGVITSLFGVPGIYTRPVAAEFVAALGAWRVSNED